MSNSAPTAAALLNRTSLAEVRRLNLVARYRISSDILGAYRSAFRGSGLSFADIREYMPGDDARRIHWKASARSTHTYVKSFEEERQLRVLLVFDASASTRAFRGAGGFTVAQEFCALVAVAASQSRDAIGVCRFARTVESLHRPKGSRSQLHRVLRELVLDSDSRGTDLRRALESARRSLRGRSLVFVVSDFLATDWQDEFRLLAREHDLTAVVLPCSFPSLPAGVILELADAETGEATLVDLMNQQQSRGAELVAQHHHNRLKSLCASVGCGYLPLSSRPLEALVRFCHERAHLRGR